MASARPRCRPPAARVGPVRGVARRRRARDRRSRPSTESLAAARSSPAASRPERVPPPKPAPLEPGAAAGSGACEAGKKVWEAYDASDRAAHAQDRLKALRERAENPNEAPRPRSRTSE